MMGQRDSVLLRAFKSAPSGQAFEPLVDRYLPCVLASARRMTGSDAAAPEVAQAVFVALARNCRALSPKTVLVEWLFQATRAAARKQKRHPASGSREWVAPVAPISGEQPEVSGSASTQVSRADGDTWARISPLLDPALARLKARHRAPVLLGTLLDWDVQKAAETIRIKPRRFEKRFAKGLAKFQRQLRKRKLLIDNTSLRQTLAANGCAAVIPPGLKEEIVASAEAAFRAWRPKLPLARGILCSLAWARWRRFLKFAGAAAGVFVVLLGATILTGWWLWTSGRMLPWLIEFGARQQLKQMPELAEPVRPWRGPAEAALAGGKILQSADELYRTTNVWSVHLKFTPEQWAGLKPKRVPAVPNFIQPDGTILLRNPNAQRSGVAGILGFDFEWTSGDLEFSGALFTNVAVRFRGNGTYLGSLWGSKQSFKADLNKNVKGQELAGVRTLNFLNVIEDRSYMHDALGYELFRAAGVPGPRTAYAWLTVSVIGEFDRKPLGLYVMVENIDGDFAKSRFGSKKTPIFKPVTPELFKDLGDDWAAYATIYDLKTEATPQQIRRVIDFARLLTSADDAEFERRVGEFLDLDAFARYLAALVLVANYDSFLTYGQNYYLYLDPQSGKFGFMPWDMDQAWGSFPQFGTAETRERASIWHPWTLRNRLLERLMEVEDFRNRYRASLDELLKTAFVPEKLWARIDELAPFIRDAIAAESSYRLRLFDQAVSTNWLAGPRDGGEGPKRPVHQVKRFIVNRAESVREQLEGRSKGVELRSSANWGGRRR